MVITDDHYEKGNWDYDQYMLGLYNGLELALSIMDDKEPEYREIIQPK